LQTIAKPAIDFMTTKRKAFDLLLCAANQKQKFAAPSWVYGQRLFGSSAFRLFNAQSFFACVTATGYFRPSIIQLLTTLVSYQPMTATCARFFRTHSTCITLNFAI
jgi:hypothetical protein